MKPIHRILCSAAVFVLAAALPGQSGSIVDTRHNLSAAGPGPIRSAGESEICIFCHTPHSARSDVPFLWNRRDQTVTYIPYRSTTLTAAVGQPTGASKLCLSCHDGTIALGAVLARDQEIPFIGGVRLMPATSPAWVGTDLSDDHPVSLVYDSRLAQSRGELTDPALLPPEVTLDGSGQMQCTACHNPHDNDLGQFLVMRNDFGQLCIACHQPTGWTAGSHAVANAQWNGQGADPWPRSDLTSVAQNACSSCHRPHGAAKPQRLLNQRFEEDNCLVCHNGNVAQTRIDLVITRPFRHPVQDTVDVHDAAENFVLGNVSHHVECEDCHNPHQVNPLPSPGAPLVSGATTGVTGIDATGLVVDPAPNQYEICYQCHADNNVIAVLPITRQIAQLNVRQEFNPANPSFHPVAAPGVNPDVPSLIAPLTTASMIFCMDCHNNSDLAGPRGPHGSDFDFILERNYDTRDNTNESPVTFALCYKCHSRASILNDDSFSLHNFHIVDQNAPCSACHDPHGISILQGSPVNNTHLINFDLTIVGPANGTPPRFVDQGRLAGNCTLDCHGEEHDAEEYP
jgi:predicted CXXCH cytochrome family protein